MDHKPSDDVYFRHIVAALDSLPTLPVVAMEGMKRALNPAGSTEDLANIVELDPPLTAKILKVANTPYYGKPGRIISLQEAFRTLGFATLRSIVLSVSAVEFYSDQKEDYGLDLAALWKHSIATAVWARQLAGRVRQHVDPEEAFVSGLLHDIGKVVFCSHLKGTYREIIAHAETSGVPLHKAERERIGYDHTDVSHWIFEHWRIPAIYREVILHHHHPAEKLFEKPQDLVLCRLVQLCNHLSYFFEIGTGGDPGPHEPVPLLLENLGITRQHLDEMHVRIQTDAKDLMDRLDWEPVSQSLYLPTIMEANKELGSLREQEQIRRRQISRKQKELSGINALGLQLQGCCSDREALRHLSETLVSRFPFERADCALYLNRKWEILCHAKKAGSATQGHTILVEQNRQPEPYASRDPDGPTLFVDLIGKQGPLGYIKVRPENERPVGMETTGLLLASCAKLASEAIERIQSHQKVRRLTENLKRSIARLDEERVRVEEEKTIKESMFTGIPLALLLLDEDGHVRYSNAPAEKLFPRLAQGHRGTFQELLPDPRFQEGVQSILDGEEFLRDESRVADPETGFHRIVQWSLVPAGKQRGSGKALLCILDDVTDERALQRRLMESARMASIGELATGTAHNLRSPLGAVKGILELLLEELEAENIVAYSMNSTPPEPTPAVKEQIRLVLQSMDKSFSIIDDLLQFARKPDRPPETIRLAELLEGTETLLGELLRERGIRVEKELRADQLFGRKTDLMQIFLNLYTNAYKAMPKGGVIRIRSRETKRRASTSPFMEIRISDTGCGIPAENLDRIFDPFFTTSDRVEGTGLGLSMTRKIVREHGGTIEATSTVGEGTHFLLTLPVSPDAFLGGPDRPAT